jgi:phage-related protein
MSDTTNPVQEFAGLLAQQAVTDARTAAVAALPKVEDDIKQLGQAASAAVDALGTDAISFAEDLGSKLYGQAKQDVSQFIDKLPGPMPMLMQSVAVLAEQAIDQLSGRSLAALSAEEKALVGKMNMACGQAFSVLGSFFERKLQG